MIPQHLHELATGKNDALPGLGSVYGSTVYPGYGWGRMVDVEDFFPHSEEAIALSFHREANRIAEPAAKNAGKTGYPLQWK